MSSDGRSKIDGEHTEAHFNKAVTCEDTGRIGEAIEAYRSFLPHALDAYVHYIEYAKKRTGDREGGRRTLILLLFLCFFR
jgi:hypothetical protein